MDILTWLINKKGEILHTISKKVCFKILDINNEYTIIKCIGGNKTYSISNKNIIKYHNSLLSNGKLNITDIKDSNTHETQNSIFILISILGYACNAAFKLRPLTIELIDFDKTYTLHENMVWIIKI